MPERIELIFRWFSLHTFFCLSYVALTIIPVLWYCARKPSDFESSPVRNTTWMVDELDTMSEGVEPHMGGPAGVSSNSPLLSVRNICGNQQNNGQNNDQNDTENFEDQVNRTL